MVKTAKTCWCMLAVTLCSVTKTLNLKNVPLDRLPRYERIESRRHLGG